MLPYFRGLDKYLSYKRHMLHSMSCYNIPPPIHYHYIYPESELRKIGFLNYRIKTLDRRQTDRDKIEFPAAGGFWAS